METSAREPAEILVVDSDLRSLFAAAEILERAGYLVYQAGDRSGALRIARREAIDLVICDASLAGASGLDVCGELRALPGMQDVPVMFISQTQLPDIIRRSHAAGAAYYLRKPLDPNVLIDLVGKAVWLPPTVPTRVALHQPAPQSVPAPQRPLSTRAAAVQGIRLPLA
jgi:CheY-like chemotaxis protein